MSSVVRPGKASGACNVINGQPIGYSQHSRYTSRSFSVSSSLVLATPALQLINVFLMVRGWFSPGAKCSTGGTSISACSFHSGVGVGVGGYWVVFKLAIKLLRDFSLV